MRRKFHDMILTTILTISLSFSFMNAPMEVKANSWKEYEEQDVFLKSNKNQNDILDYAEDGHYRYNGVDVYPDEDGFVICDGVLIGYHVNFDQDAEPKKITIPSSVTEIYGVFNKKWIPFERNEYHRQVIIIIPKSVEKISDSFRSSDVWDLRFEERDGEELIIGDNCFCWFKDCERLDLPDGTVSIGKGCIDRDFSPVKGYGIKYIYIPDTVKKIEKSSAYRYTIIYCNKGSYAEKYAKKNNFRYSTQVAPDVDVRRNKAYFVEGFSEIKIDYHGYDVSRVTVKSSNPAVIAFKNDGYEITGCAKKAGKATVTVSAGNFSSKCQVTVLKNTEENVIKCIINNMTKDKLSDAEKTMEIGYYFRRLVRYCFYTINGDGDKHTHKYSVHTAEAALLERCAVCDGKALAYKKVMDKVGIECKVIEGSYAGGHAWNLVKIDGKWTHVDVTNDNYLMTDEEARKYGYRWSASSYPKADKEVPMPKYYSSGVGYLWTPW